MSKFFFLVVMSVFTFANNSLGNIENQLSVPVDNIEFYQVIEESAGLQIVEVKTKDGKFILNVIAAIATTFLPDAVRGICRATIGDSDACEVAYLATTALVDLRGVKIYKGAVRSMRYIASRGTYKSTATVEVKTYEMASDVKDAFEVYRDYGVKWSNVGYSSGSDCSVSATASAVFYTDIRDGGAIKVWVQGQYIGKITSYWYSGSPTCGQRGAATVRLSPGTYRYKAEDEAGCTWSGYITVESGYCSTLKLTQ